MFSGQWQKMYWRNFPIKQRIAVMHRGKASGHILNQNLQKVTDKFNFYVGNIALLGKE